MMPRVYTPPTVRKLELEERLIEQAGKWQMVRRRIASDVPSDLAEFEAFYSFCVQLSRN